MLVGEATKRKVKRRLKKFGKKGQGASNYRGQKSHKSIAAKAFAVPVDF
jgi:hypothetical protein